MKEVIIYRKKDIYWKGNYLFLATAESNGNSSKCYTTQVFTLRNNKLIHLGYLFSDAADYKNGFFYDLYNKLELSTLTSHARLGRSIAG